MKQSTLWEEEVIDPPIAWHDYVTTLDFDERKIIKSIIKLYNNGRPFDVDPTYSKGVFWEGLPQPVHKFDINPQVEGVTQGDARSLPLGNESVSSVMFDPPFVVAPSAAPGIIRDRFSCYANVKELWTFYRAALTEFVRVLRPAGIIAFKCQDMVSSGRNHWSHIEIMKMALTLELDAVDLFVLGRHNVLWSPNMKNQKHARKNHSFYWVFRKGGKS